MTNPNERRERELIALLQETGDPAVADSLFAEKAPILRRFLLARGAAIDDVDDIVQDALLSAFLHIHKFKGAAQFTTWLCRIAYTKWIDSTRKIGRVRKLVSQILDRGLDDIPASSEICVERFDEILAVLSDPQRNVFLYCDWLGYSHNEAAKRLKLPLGSVKSYVIQARQLIHERVEQHHD